MIFGRDLLYIHVPKTGGMSTTAYLLDVLPKPVYLTHPTDVWNDELPDQGVVHIVGKRHETLAEARDVVACHGFDIRRFPMILATIRNPYDLEVSRYAYLRAGYPWQRGPEQDLALASSFEEFAVKNEQRGGHWLTSDPEIHAASEPGAPPGHGEYPNEIKDFYTLDGLFLENLRIVRFEQLVDDLVDALATLEINGHGDVPWVNESLHHAYQSYYTPGAEEAVYRRYRWVFDHGFYPRLDSAWLPSRAAG